jgi:hypothetical protein
LLHFFHKTGILFGFENIFLPFLARTDQRGGVRFKRGKYGCEEGTWKSQQRGNIKRRKYKKNFKMKKSQEEPWSGPLKLKGSTYCT